MQKMGGNLQALLQMRFQMVEKFGYQNITISVMNSNHLQIGVVNAPVSAGPGLREKAVEMARFAYSKYPTRTELNSVGVSFGSQQSFIVLHFSSVIGQFMFRAPDQVQ